MELQIQHSTSTQLIINGSFAFVNGVMTVKKNMPAESEEAKEEKSVECMCLAEQK